MPIDALSELDHDTLFERLAAQRPGEEPAVAVLCVSRRYAQRLQDAYARAQAQRGVAAWAGALILPAETFLIQLGERERLRRSVAGRPLPVPLSEAESALLWRLVVGDARGEQGLLREAEAAQLAAEALRLCQDYGIALPLPVSTPDVERFNHWVAVYADRCARLRRPDAGDYRRQLLDLLAARELAPPATVVFAGFEMPPPWLQALCAALQMAGCEVLRLRPQRVQARTRACVAATAEQELRAAAQWVLDRARRDPGARLGVVVPDLGARRADVMRVFDQTLCPSLDALHGRTGERPYNLSLGESLAEVGLVQCALWLLRLCTGGLELAEAGALLCAPYWGGDESERLLRADLDRVLRAEGHLRVDLALLRALSGRVPALHRRVAQLAQARAAMAAAPPGEWAERFTAWLDAAGWPGPRTLDSAEFQALEAWRGLLRELGLLGGVLGRIAASGALTQLQQLAQQRVFQPQTPPVSIHVLGALEAQGLDFGALWVLGLDDERWPPKGQPNPFIPYALQRRHALPHASAEIELASAERLTQGWRSAAPVVVFSWAASELDRPLSPSPLVQAEAATAEPVDVDATAPAWRDAASSGRMHHVADAYAPPPAAGAAVPGGARLLGDQARCPFRAFATHRLTAQPLEQPGYGPSYRDRGQLVHRALEALWRSLRNQAALQALDDASLDAHIAEAVDAALERCAQTAPQRFPKALRELERTRLRALLAAWMRIERERPPFSVEWIEGSAPEDAQAAPPDTQLVDFAGLRLRLRPDRIDRLADGARLVIDYKTGAKRPLPWHDGRPEEPQLLLYALTGADVEGLAYARLTAGTIGFDGIAASDALAPGLRSYADYRETREAASWGALMGRWRGELETLAAEIRRGLASVTPKNTHQSCRDCHLHAACRIRETFPAFAFDDELEPEAGRP
ncbi:MAG: PD-(D/E)XK nuclease family protein [Gammaproteobacteria bacterium]